MSHQGYRTTPGPRGCTPYLLQARWMTAAALFLLRNSSFLLLSFWMICSRSSTGRRSIFTLCTERGPGAGSVSLDICASSVRVGVPSFLTPELNTSVLRGKSEQISPASLSCATLLLGVRWWRGVCPVWTTSPLALPGRLEPAGEHLPPLSSCRRLFWEADLALGAVSCCLLCFRGPSGCGKLVAAQLGSSPFSPGPATLLQEGCFEKPFPLSHCGTPTVSAEEAPRHLFPSLPSVGLKWTQEDRPLECSLDVSWGNKGKEKNTYCLKLAE